MPSFVRPSLTALSTLALLFQLSACGSSDKKPEEKLVEKAKEEKPEGKPVEDMKLKVEAEQAPKWTYEGALGPANWGSIDKSYELCAKGSQQSPINLKWKKPSNTESLRFSFKEEPLKIVNTGDFFALVMNAGQNAIFAENQYSLQAIEVRSPSEHKFSGKEFPAELAFVHRDNKGKLAIVSVMLTPGKANAALNRVLPHLPEEKNKMVTVASQSFHPLALLPVNYNHYRYSGSLSTPPCTEGVLRLVLNTPIEASEAQLAKLRSYYYKNRRPIQPIKKQDPQLFFGQ